MSSIIKHQQFLKSQKYNFQKLNMIDLQMNMTKAVVKTLPNYHWKEFVIHQKKKFNFSQPISPSKSIFQPIWAIFRGHYTLHGMHLSQMHLSI